MTQITGQIYQMHNGKTGAQRVNRFPITVMEAVYGLNSYLQNQFSALADIYMPIEGITESKPLQEFVYRLCPSSIKAKSVSLDRIYGKTLAWNQLAPAFTDTTRWTTGGDSATRTATSITIECTSAYSGPYLSGLNALSSHKYCFRFIAGNSSTKRASCEFGGSVNYSLSIEAGESNQRHAVIASANSNYIRWYYGSSPYGTLKLEYFCITDLTLLYGSEIDGMTDAEILAKFESEFPGYHSYETGKLISNDAESIETVGFNLWDEETRHGSYNASTGVYESTSNLCNKNPIPVFPSTEYMFYTPETIRICYYDANMSFISSEIVNNNKNTTPANCRFINFHCASIQTYSHNICINLSDPAKNGTYEPYRKSVVQLGLGSFQVRDSQGNVTTITGGLKSAGFVYDEIVGNKYIKRVGSVDLGTLTWGLSSSASNVFYTTDNIGRKINSGSQFFSGNGILQKYVLAIADEYGWNNHIDELYDSDKSFCLYNGDNNTQYVHIHDSAYTDAAAFKTAMSGVYLDYELATPIEYELVSPLVPTVKAGETEARISPNSDGLSAPMVADMTYDAQANNDSASAQYALTAGRLLNSHKLWGQDFDGTQDVTGALTGVTNLNSLLYLGSTNVGIGQSNPQYKLDVSGTFRATGAAIFGNSLNVANSAYVNTYLFMKPGSAGIYFDDIGVRWHNANNDWTKDLIVFDSSGNSSVRGNFTVGTSSVNKATTLYGTLNATGAATFGSTIHAAGGIDSDSYITAGAVNSSSDTRLKNNITSVVGAMDTIMSLKPSEWIWNEKHHLNGQKGAGLVAQEVEKVLPFAVAKEGEFLSLNYNVFHAYEIAGLQNHEERIKALEAENAELRRRLGA